MFENVRADLRAAASHRRLERGWRVIIRRETKAILQYRFSHWVHTLEVPVVKQLLLIVALVWQRWNQIMLSGVLIAPDAEIGPGMVLHTAYGLQISPVKIGSGCTFNSQVLIGTGVKSIGDNCYFGPGCKIVGECKIGNNVLVVANSVVLTDVPDNTTIMGIPARIKLPGGRLRKMPWKTLDAKKNASKADGAKPNVSKPNGANTEVPVAKAAVDSASVADVPAPDAAKTNGNGSKVTNLPKVPPQPKPQPQQNIGA